MTLFRGERAIGRYGGSPVTAMFRQQVLAIQRAGGGVVNARTLLRDAGFRFRNQAVTDIFREIRAIDARAGDVRITRNTRRPTRASISRVNMRFKTRFQYSGTVSIRNQLTGVLVDTTVTFGDNELLTGGEVRERFEAMGERIIAFGPEACDLEGAIVEQMQFLAVLEGDIE